MNIEKIDHISIAVRDLNKARSIYENTLGLKLHLLYASEEEKINVARYRVGDVWLELMESIGDGEVSRFLENNGEGIFVISYKVPDVELAMKELKEKGYRLIDAKPRYLLNNRYAFINHPRELFGVLTEIIDDKN